MTAKFCLPLKTLQTREWRKTYSSIKTVKINCPDTRKVILDLVASTYCLSDCSGQFMKSAIHLSPAHRDLDNSDTPDTVGHEAPAFWCHEYECQR